MEENTSVQDTKPVSEESSETPEVESKPQYTEYERQLYERLKKAEDELKNLRKLQESARKEVSPQLDETARRIEEKVELRMEGYTTQEIAEMEKYAAGAKLSLREAKDNDFVKSAITKLRADKKADETIPEPSSRSVTIEGKTWDTMSQQERASNYQTMVQKFQKR